ncbi:MAG: hypothetical protein SPF72_01065 [Parabacteroides sp.]|nr:hypothetical protein [Parabacteroides sp.]
MHYSEASTTSETLTGVAMVLNGKAYQISNVGSSSTYWWYSGYYNIDGLTDYDRVDASNSSGYLGGSSSPQLDKDYTVWSVGALSDFSGRNNTEKIIVAQDDGFTTHTIAYTIVDFRNGANNWNAQIFDDWYVPAAGQLAFLYLNKDKINTLLEKCGGRSLGDYRLWTSTEYNADYVWYVDFSYKGEVNYKKKNDMGYSNDYVRFIRDL